MRYMGGKVRISKPLSEFLNKQLTEGEEFVDLFCGSCNVVSNIRQDVLRVANDKNKYLIAMWKCIQDGWLPPSDVTEEFYHEVKNMPDDSLQTLALKSFVGYGCSFSGKWWGGYARGGEGRNYAQNAFNTTMKKSDKMKDVLFLCADYKDFVARNNSIIYCDIPYKDTTEYGAVGAFNHEEFYEWMKNQSAKVFVSEYAHNVPSFGKVVWELESKKDMRDKNGEQKQTTEVLFTL